MIKIEIDNAGATPAHELRAVAACLIAIADTASQPKNPIAELKDRLRYGPNDEYAIGAYETLAELIAIAEAPSKVAPDLAEVKASIDEQIKAFDTPIAAEDRPDSGAPEGESLREPAIDPKVVFGAALGNVPAVPASSTVAVAALPTVPAVPPATSTTAASVPLPPVPPVPGADAQTDEDVASDAQFDSTGLPWDARIHSRGRSMNANGTWRSKRGVDDATVAAVSAELRAVPGVPATTLAEDVATAEASWPFQPLAGAVVPPPPPVAAVVSFPAFMGKYVPLVSAGKITQAQITEILVAHGIPSLPLLSARTDLLPTIAAQLDALIAA